MAGSIRRISHEASSSQAWRRQVPEDIARNGQAPSIMSAVELMGHYGRGADTDHSAEPSLLQYFSREHVLAASRFVRNALVQPADSLVMALLRYPDWLLVGCPHAMISLGGQGFHARPRDRWRASANSTTTWPALSNDGPASSLLLAQPRCGRYYCLEVSDILSRCTKSLARRRIVLADKSARNSCNFPIISLNCTIQ